MSSVVSDWLKAPVFPGDENKTRSAYVLHTMLVVCLGGMVVYAALVLALSGMEFKALHF